MAEVLKKVPQSNHPDLLVGFNKADDAGIFKISPTQALVQTVDFFPPIVDDPYYFGQIAAANALSDVYAMGGRPVTALSIVGFPMEMDPSILSDILKGGSDKVEEAKTVIVGGHSIKDKELKYGLSITGLIDPENIITNANAQAGDNLYLSKKLGTGIITTAIKNDAVDDALIDLVIAQMAELNRDTAELMLRHNVNGATDITGFGLLGHLFEMADGSAVSVELDSQALPLLPEVLNLIKAKMVPGGANANREYLDGKFKLINKIDPHLETLLFDPQTSGGLLMAIPDKNSAAFEKDADKNNIDVVKVASVIEQKEFPIYIN